MVKTPPDSPPDDPFQSGGCHGRIYWPVRGTVPRTDASGTIEGGQAAAKVVQVVLPVRQAQGSADVGVQGVSGGDEVVMDELGGGEGFGVHDQ